MLTNTFSSFNPVYQGRNLKYLGYFSAKVWLLEVLFVNLHLI